MQANRWDARDQATIEKPTSKGHPYRSPLSWGSSATGGVNLAGWSKLRFQDVYEAGQKVSSKELESTHISLYRSPQCSYSCSTPILVLMSSVRLLNDMHAN
jgi:hypothetical protein